MKKLRIALDLPHAPETMSEAFAEHIADVIKDHEAFFSERMDGICREREMRAELLEDTLEILDISLYGSGGSANVSYDYDAYYGCKDMNHSDTVEDDWPFEVAGTKLIFELDIPEERYDEI